MKILVLTDSHKKLKNIIEMYKRENPDMVLCAGDHSFDCEELSYVYPSSKYYIVVGNCDYDDMKNREDEIIEVEDIKILLTHGHMYGVKRSYRELKNRGMQLECDLIIFGHTHTNYLEFPNQDNIDIENKEPILFNPGAAKDENYGIIKITKDKKIIIESKVL